MLYSTLHPCEIYSQILLNNLVLMDLILVRVLKLVNKLSTAYDFFCY